MNMNQLARAVADSTDQTVDASSSAVKAVFDAISAELVKGGSVTIQGFGTFEVRDRAERQGRNPRTGESITIAASKGPAFKASSSLRDAVNGK